MVSSAEGYNELKVPSLIAQIKLLTLAFIISYKWKIGTQCDSSSTKYRSKHASCGSSSGNLVTSPELYGWCDRGEGT